MLFCKVKVKGADTIWVLFAQNSPNKNKSKNLPTLIFCSCNSNQTIFWKALSLGLAVLRPFWTHMVNHTYSSIHCCVTAAQDAHLRVHTRRKMGRVYYNFCSYCYLGLVKVSYVSNQWFYQANYCKSPFGRRNRDGERMIIETETTAL